jgi:predicted nuclease with TOPRIM domain
MLSRSGIDKALAPLGLSQNSTLIAAHRERDQAIKERDQAIKERDQALAELKAVQEGEYDYIPAALRSALTERDALRKQRDQAYGEIDDLCRERNELKGQLERLRRQGLIP